MERGGGDGDPGAGLCVGWAGAALLEMGCICPGGSPRPETQRVSGPPPPRLHLSGCSCLPALAARWLFCSALPQLPGSCTVPFSLSFNFSLFSFPSMGSVTLSPEVRTCHPHPSHWLLAVFPGGWGGGLGVRRCARCPGSPAVPALQSQPRIPSRGGGCWQEWM